MTVTYQVGDGGHLDIDFWVLTFLYQFAVYLTTQHLVDRPSRERAWETNQTVYRSIGYHCGEGWAT